MWVQYTMICKSKKDSKNRKLSEIDRDVYFINFRFNVVIAFEESNLLN